MKLITNTQTYDMVNHPSHYGGRNNPYEVIKVIEAWDLDKNFYLATVLRYIARAGKKPGNDLLTDLKKAQSYLNRQINKLQGKEELKFEKVVYLSHPFNNDPENHNIISLLMEELIIKHPDTLFVSPVHSYGFLYEKLDYNTGLDLCIGMLERADEMWVFGDWQQSRGCTAEVEFCSNNNIPYRFLARVKE